MSKQAFKLKEYNNKLFFIPRTEAQQWQQCKKLLSVYSIYSIAKYCCIILQNCTVNDQAIGTVHWFTVKYQKTQCIVGYLIFLAGVRMVILALTLNSALEVLKSVQISCTSCGVSVVKGTDQKFACSILPLQWLGSFLLKHQPNEQMDYGLYYIIYYNV